MLQSKFLSEIDRVNYAKCQPYKDFGKGFLGTDNLKI